MECPGDLPAASDPDLVARARAAKEQLGERVFVLGHHYQRDEVIAFADVTGDSFKLARDAAARPEAEFIVFCGVHFMAESADILTSPEQKVVLPDLAAGCSMADMARLRQVEDAWDALTDAGVADVVVPVTYMNSSADIKAFCGRHGGAVCTSSNAAGRARVGLRAEGTGHQGAVPARPAPRSQHRRAASWGSPSRTASSGTRCCPAAASAPERAARREDDPLEGALLGARAVLRRRWSTSCARRIPDVQILVHPECRHEVVIKADLVGSTEFIIKTIEAAPAGSSWAIGTELNLVKRLADAHPEQKIVVPRPDRLLLLDDEPDRPAAPRLGARVAGRRPASST